MTHIADTQRDLSIAFEGCMSALYAKAAERAAEMGVPSNIVTPDEVTIAFKCIVEPFHSRLWSIATRIDPSKQLVTMLTGLAKMRAASRGTLPQFGYPVPFEKNPAWTLWITNHLRPLSPRAPVGKSLNEKLAAIEDKYEGNDKKMKTQSKRAKDKDINNTVDRKQLRVMLNLLPHFAIDALWLHRSMTEAMAWLHADLREHCTYVHDRYLARTWLAQSNVLCFLDQYRSPSNNMRLSSHITQKIARMALPVKPLPLTEREAVDLPIRLPKVASRAVIASQLSELAASAASVPLGQLRAHLKRMYQSIGEEEDSSSKKQREN